jgi:glycosyltransferase involved in cell wall biosynthesis
MLSIIIPTYNEESVIESTLRAIRSGLTKFPYELIVADDESTDRTVEIATPIADRVLQGTKVTIAAGRNRGAAAATGEYLVFIDADVVIPEPDRFFEQALACFECDPRLVGLTVNLRVHPNLATRADRIIFGAVNLVHRFDNNILRRGSASGEFQMVKTDVFRKLGGYNERLTVTEDNEFFSRLSRVGRTRFEPTLTVLHTGRRAHRIGWPKLLCEWARNALSAAFLKRSANKEWKPIR